MSNVKYREVSRKANAGERIKIVAADQAFGYSNGDTFTVSDANRWKVVGSGQAVSVAEVGIAIYHREYVVLEPIAAPAQTTVNLPDLFAQFIRDNAPAVRSYLAELDPVDSADVFEIATPLTRAKVIEMARERVSELKRIGSSLHLDLPKGTPFYYRYYNVEFHVNRDKRTVTALVHVSGNQRKPNAVGIAKAAPDDVFNVDIGKAIAAERALGLALTPEFVNAPNPAEPLAGMWVENRGRVRTVVASSKDYVYGKTGTLKSLGVRESRIIDDTDAVYTQATFEPCEAV